jgi:cytochrome oxidase assembly protein ShyY1
MYRFLATPKWVAGVVLATTTVALFVALGFWQLSRQADRELFNTTLTERAAAAPVQAQALRTGDPGALTYRRARLEGTYEPEREVLLAAQSLGGRAGHHVLTPLRTEDGLVVIVDRGWVPMEETDPPIDAAAPPAGPVVVDGLLLPAQSARRAGSFDAGSGLEFVSALDLEHIAAWLGEPVAPLALRAQAQEPANPGALPATPALPEVDEGNHLSYAVQWFLFAGVVAVGFPILVWRVARDRGTASAAPAARLEERAGT